MKNSNNTRIGWTKIRSILLCMLMALFIFCTSIAFGTVQVNSGTLSPREQIKARLMRQIRFEGWDPYSSDMTTEEFYALMELFSEGKLPLEKQSASGPSLPFASVALADGLGIEEPSVYDAAENLTIPRSYFMYAGLPDKFLGGYDEETGIEHEQLILPYDNSTNYEMSDPAYPELEEPWTDLGDNRFEYTDGSIFRIDTYHDPATNKDRKVLYLEHAGSEQDPEDEETLFWEISARLAINYPAGLDKNGVGYARPLTSWEGVNVGKGPELTIVKETKNSAPIGGYVDQQFFEEFEGYYVKNVTIAGAEVTVLGVITLKSDEGEKYVYYYKTSKEQGGGGSVSSTTLPENTKFVVQYMPYERGLTYEVQMAEGATKTFTQSDIFGDDPVTVTTDGEYAFTVYAPKGYMVDIYISFDMSVDDKYVSKQPENYYFHVETRHTGSKEDLKATYLERFKEYLLEEGLIEKEEDFGYTETDIGSGEIELTWNGTAPAGDVPTHNGVLAKIAERVNDYIPHNSGYAIGTYPVYDYDPNAGEKKVRIPDTTRGPAVMIWEDVFKNHNVKADRHIRAVVTPASEPVFNGKDFLETVNGTKGRGTSAAEDYNYEADFQFNVNGIGTDPYPSRPAGWPNLGKPINGSWNWGDFQDETKTMNRQSDGSYSYTYMFQTNGSDSFFLDALSINGVSIMVPFTPRYDVRTGTFIPGDQKELYSTETMIDGALVTVEYLLVWRATKDQRHYRITIENANCDMVLTGMNLMQYDSGAEEVSVYNLEGIYSGDNQKLGGIEYFNGEEWIPAVTSEIIVKSYDLIHNHGDKYGANIRFKIVDGYGNPYFYYRSSEGLLYDPTTGGMQTSILPNADGSYSLSGSFEYNEVRSVGDPEQLGEDGKIIPQFIYRGEGENSEYYYIRLTGQNDANNQVRKMSMLTIVARTIRYVVRYESTPIRALNEDGTWDEAKDQDGNPVYPDEMPFFMHSLVGCDFYQIVQRVNATLREQGREDEMINASQFDDNGGSYYDGFQRNEIIIASDGNGAITPVDPSGYFNFAGWILVDADNQPVRGEDGNYFIYSGGGTIDLNPISDYAYNRSEFGSDVRDIQVFRLAATWVRVNNPYHYRVYLSWIDATGAISVDERTETWSEVLTQEPSDGKLYVHLNRDALPLLNWIAEHPTYTFWDAVNSAVSDSVEEERQQMQEAVDKYYQKMPVKPDASVIEDIIAALMNRDYNTEIKGADFTRVGSDNFIVHEDHGIIVIWMYEDKGGFIFRKEVPEDSREFNPNEEFYFTVRAEVQTDEGAKTLLNGTYKAYPDKVFDNEGNEKDITDADSWTMTFTEGVITRMVKGGKVLEDSNRQPVTYFTLKSGQGIQMYVPDGDYTIYELGSKSGGSYKVDVEYTDENAEYGEEQLGWVQDLPKGHVVKGSQKTLTYGVNENTPGAEYSQVAAKFNFALGEKYVVHTVTFTNRNTVLSVEKQLLSSQEKEEELKGYMNDVFSFTVELWLPDETKTGESYTPLSGTNETWYFDTLTYTKDSRGVVHASSGKLPLTKPVTEGDPWTGTFSLKAGEKIEIIMRSPYIDSNQTAQPTISYKVTESQPRGELVVQYTRNEGVATSDTTTTVIVTNFLGNVTYGYLAITETGGDGSNGEHFLYRVIGAGVDITVSVLGNGVTYVYVPLGTYTVEEVSDWSWKYSKGKGTSDDDKTAKEIVSVTVRAANVAQTSAAHADFINRRNNLTWVGGEDGKRYQ